MLSSTVSHVEALKNIYHSSLSSVNIVAKINDYLFALKNKNEPGIEKIVIEFKQHIQEYKSDALPRYVRQTVFLDADFVTETNEYKNLIATLNRYLSFNDIDTMQEALASLSNVIQMLFAYVMHHPIQALCALLLIQHVTRISAAMHGVGDESFDPSSTDNFETIKTNQSISFLKSLCATRLNVINHPANITFGAEKGIIKPKSCLNGKHDRQCRSDNRAVKYFTVDRIKDAHLANERSICKSTILNWQAQFFNNIDTAITSYSKDKKVLATLNKKKTAELDVATTDIKNKISELKYRYLITAYAFRLQEGNCGEHASVAITILLQQHLLNNINIKIQLVSASQTVKQNRVDDHAFIIIDSNLPDVHIKNDAEKVAAYWNQAREGWLCDPWNNGYFAPLVTDDSGLCTSSEQWNNLVVESFNPDFKLERIPREFDRVQSVMCKELENIDPLLAVRNGCRR